MLFATADGAGAVVESPPKRTKVRLDSGQLRILRGRTCRSLVELLTVDQLAALYNISRSTIERDMALVDGSDRLPWDRLEPVADE